MQQDSKDPAVRSFRDDERGDVLVLSKAELPTLTPGRAAEWMQELGVPVTEGQLMKARRRGQIAGSLVCNRVLFSKRELLDWLERCKGGVHATANLSSGRWSGR